MVFITNNTVKSSLYSLCKFTYQSNTQLKPSLSLSTNSDDLYLPKPNKLPKWGLKVGLLRRDKKGKKKKGKLIGDLVIKYKSNEVKSDNCL